MIGRNADYRRQDYFYSRQSSPWLELEHSAPLAPPIWKDLLAGLALMFFLTVVIVLTA